jgi:DNA-binding response OmpR family regulator
MSVSIPQGNGPKSRRTVLLIDHESSVRHVLQVCLDDLGGWNVEGAATLWQGLEILKEVTPELILLDAPCLEICAQDLVTQLRENTWVSPIPIVFITAKAGWFSKEQLQNLGVAGALPKPFNPSTLPDQIRALLPVSVRQKKASM